MEFIPNVGIDRKLASLFRPQDPSLASSPAPEAQADRRADLMRADASQQSPVSHGIWK